MIPEAIPMHVKAGEAVILNQSVIHYSPPNRSDKVRKAITAGVKSAGAPMRFHYKLPDADQLEVFDMPEDFLISFNDFYKDIFERPKLGKSLGFVNYTNPVLSRKAVTELISNMKSAAGFATEKQQQASKEPKSFLKRLAQVFQ